MTAVSKHPPIYLVRHGETDWNAAGRLQGQRDIGLNSHGRAQARRNGAALARHFAAAKRDPAGLRYLASPLGRTRETMEILRRSLGLPREGYVVDARLMEVSFGEVEGLTLAEFAAQDPTGFKAREADRWGYVPRGGESYAQLSARAASLLAELDGPSVIVAHGGILRALYHLLLGRSVRDAMTMPVSQDEVHLFENGSLRGL